MDEEILRKKMEGIVKLILQNSDIKSSETLKLPCLFEGCDKQVTIYPDQIENYLRKGQVVYDCKDEGNKNTSNNKICHDTIFSFQYSNGIIKILGENLNEKISEIKPCGMETNPYNYYY